MPGRGTILRCAIVVIAALVADYAAASITNIQIVPMLERSEEPPRHLWELAFLWHLLPFVLAGLIARSRREVLSLALLGFIFLGVPLSLPELFDWKAALLPVAIVTTLYLALATASLLVFALASLLRRALKAAA